MKNTCYLLLLLASAITSATSQSQDCIEVRNELVNNRECGHAMTTVGLLLRGYNVVIDRRFLNAYCSRSCRNINIRIDYCNPDQDVDEESTSAALDVLCSVNGEMYCIEYLVSSQLASLNTAVANGDCAMQNNNETCSDNCAAVIEDFLTEGECCAEQVLRFQRSRMGSNLTYDQVLSYCDTANVQFTNCEVIFINSNASGAKKITQIAYGGLLLIAIITATIF